MNFDMKLNTPLQHMSNNKVLDLWLTRSFIQFIKFGMKNIRSSLCWLGCKFVALFSFKQFIYFLHIRNLSLLWCLDYFAENGYGMGRIISIK